MKRSFLYLRKSFSLTERKGVKEEMEKIAIREFFKWLRVLGNSSVI